jgi:hypothetical protein
MQRIIVALLLAATVTAAERMPGPVPDGPVGEADVGLGADICAGLSHARSCED